MKRSIVIFLLVLFPICAIAQSASADLQKILNQLHTMQAHFVQSPLGRQTRMRQVTIGDMQIKKPGYFRWDIQKPSKQLIVADGKKLYLYDADLEQVTVQDLRQGLGDSPAMILSGDSKALLKQYHVSSPALGYFNLLPNHPGESFKRIRLYFNNKHLAQMWLTDSLDRESRIDFSAVTYNKPILDRVFYFHPPKGVDVINRT